MKTLTVFLFKFVQKCTYILFFKLGVSKINILIARQPIFDKKMRVYGYELLYRGSMKRGEASFDGDRATSEVILNSFYNNDIDTIIGGKRAFINFTDNLLKEDIPQMLSKDKVIIEVLENVQVDDAVVEACQSLKNTGYILALDDFVFENLRLFNRILPYVDIIKVDFLETNFCDVKKAIMKALSQKNKRFLAEKVETQEQYKLALELGFDLFQGYFFEKPYIIVGKDIEPYKLSYMQMIKEVTETQDFDKMSEIVTHDVALSYKLLRLINSPFYGRGNKIKSAKQALVMLGLDEVKKWVTLLMLKESGKDKPDEVMRISLIRGKFAENISEMLGYENRKSEIFLMGLFSTLDAIMDKPLEEVIQFLPLEKDIIEAYAIESNSVFGKILKVIKFYEKGKWSECDVILEECGLDPFLVSAKFFDAIIWADEVMDNISF